MNKQIIFISLVVVVIIISGCTNIEESLGESFGEIGLNSCESNAKELIPYHLIITYNQFTAKVFNKWTDGTDFNFYIDDILLPKRDNCLRAGSGAGENVNYLYPLPKCYSFNYNKQVVGTDGTVLGYNRFTLIPVLKLSDKNLVMPNYQNNLGIFTSKVEWTGFTDEVKKIWGYDQITISIKNFNGELVEEIKTEPDSENDTIDFGSGLGSYISGGGKYYDYQNKRLYFEPDILVNKVYDVADYQIKDCEWIN